MKLLSLSISHPVRRLSFSLSVHSKGIPNAFQKMAVFLVKHGKESDELRNLSIPALFEAIVGGQGAMPFLERTLDELFSPTVGVLRLSPDVRFTSYGDIPVSEIELLPNGEELLATGAFPTKSRTFQRTALYDPLRQRIDSDVRDDLPDLPDDPERALPEELATSAWPEGLVDAFVREHAMRPGDVLAGIVPDESADELMWMSTKANVELVDGALSATSPSTEMQDHLNGLRPEEFQRLLLAPLDVFRPAAPGSVKDLSAVESNDLYPADSAPTAEESWIWLHPNTASAEVVPNPRLEVVWPLPGAAMPEGEAFLTGKNGAPDRLAIPASPYSDVMGSGTTRHFAHVTMGRALFAHAPVEIPIGIRERLPEDVSVRIAESIVSALVATGNVRAFAHAAVLAYENQFADTSEFKEKVEELDEEQRLRLSDICASWQLKQVAEAVLPSPQPPLSGESELTSGDNTSEPETPQAEASGSDVGIPLVSYWFEVDSARYFTRLFQGDSPDRRCEFVMTNRVVKTIGDLALSRSRSSEEKSLSRDALSAIRSCGFVSLEGAVIAKGEKPSEGVIDEILRLGAKRPALQSVLVTGNKTISQRASAIGILPMSYAEFARRIETNTLSNPIKENTHEPILRSRLRSDPASPAGGERGARPRGHAPVSRTLPRHH